MSRNFELMNNPLTYQLVEFISYFFGTYGVSALNFYKSLTS